VNRVPIKGLADGPTLWSWAFVQKPAVAQPLRKLQVFLLNPKAHYHIHKSLALVCIIPFIKKKNVAMDWIYLTLDRT
jgi:hypothetical protein